MKQSLFITVITGFLLTIAFQNCSQGNFESSSSSNNPASPTKAISDSQIQDFLARDRVEICPAIDVMCAAPPVNCHYDPEDRTTNGDRKSRCLARSCGRLVCDRLPIADVPPKEPVICPMIACSAVPTGCKRVAAATTVKDTNGCDLNCGEIKCEDPIATTEPVNPVDGNNSQSDESVQQIGIGTKPRICPMVLCAAPPEGCFYRPTSRLAGSNECPGCGELICKKPPFGTDLPPVPVE